MSNEIELSDYDCDIRRLLQVSRKVLGKLKDKDPLKQEFLQAVLDMEEWALVDDEDEMRNGYLGGED